MNETKTEKKNLFSFDEKDSGPKQGTSTGRPSRSLSSIPNSMMPYVYGENYEDLFKNTPSGSAERKQQDKECLRTRLNPYVKNPKRVTPVSEQAQNLKRKRFDQPDLKKLAEMVQSPPEISNIDSIKMNSLKNDAKTLIAYYSDKVKEVTESDLDNQIRHRIGMMMEICGKHYPNFLQIQKTLKIPDLDPFYFIYTEKKKVAMKKPIRTTDYEYEDEFYEWRTYLEIVESAKPEDIEEMGCYKYTQIKAEFRERMRRLTVKKQFFSIKTEAENLKKKYTELKNNEDELRKKIWDCCVSKLDELLDKRQFWMFQGRDYANWTGIRQFFLNPQDYDKTKQAEYEVMIQKRVKQNMEARSNLIMATEKKAAVANGGVMNRRSLPTLYSAPSSSLQKYREVPKGAVFKLSDGKMKRTCAEPNSQPKAPNPASLELQKKRLAEALRSLYNDPVVEKSPTPPREKIIVPAEPEKVVEPEKVDAPVEEPEKSKSPEPVQGPSYDEDGFEVPDMSGVDRLLEPRQPEGSRSFLWPFRDRETRSGGNVLTYELERAQDFYESQRNYETEPPLIVQPVHEIPAPEQYKTKRPLIRLPRRKGIDTAGHFAMLANKAKAKKK